MRRYSIAIVGASGAVGEEILKVLEERKFPVGELKLLASSRSSGMEIEAFGQTYVIEELREDSFVGVEIAFFSAGGSVSAKYAPYAASAGALVIDNTSHFRMDVDVPLVVPEVNPSDISEYKKRNIIANPNCSTIQMAQILGALHKKWEIKRVDVSTYQAVSGAGKSGMEELVVQMQKFFAFEMDEVQPSVFPHRIALNLFPHIDVFMENGYTKEEMKMMKETNKILHSNFAVSATCVRVPILRSHSESINIHFACEVEASEAREVLKGAKNVVVLDEPEDSLYPMPSIATDRDETYVGRIRNDLYDKKIIHLWCVADQVRVGAATNAIRIAEEWIKLENPNS